MIDSNVNYPTEVMDVFKGGRNVGVAQTIEPTKSAFRVENQLIGLSTNRYCRISSFFDGISLCDFVTSKARIALPLSLIWLTW